MYIELYYKYKNIANFYIYYINMYNRYTLHHDQL